jgi:CTP synthase (UTP-ammonia lyase)
MVYPIKPIWLQVVIEMPEHNQGQMGGTMRLGKRETTFKEGNSIMKQLYGNQVNPFETG